MESWTSLENPDTIRLCVVCICKRTATLTKSEVVLPSHFYKERGVLLLGRHYLYCCHVWFSIGDTSMSTSPIQAK